MFSGIFFLREAIRDLIAEGCPIAAAPTVPAGYFIIETREEAEAYLRDLKGRLVEDAYRRRDFKKAAAMNLEQLTQARLL